MTHIKFNTKGGCRVTKADRAQHEILFDILQEREVSETELSQMGFSSPNTVALKVEKLYGVEINRRKVPKRKSTFGYGKAHTLHFSIHTKKN